MRKAATSVRTVTAAEAETMDPRMRARRVAVMKTERRRRRRFLLLLFAAVACLGGAWAASRTHFLDVERIVVRGLTDAERIKALHAAKLSKGLPMADIKSGYAALDIEKLPWVESAEVRRRWPSVIEVDVKTRTPVAVAPSGAGSIALVDIYGYVIGKQPETYELRPMDIRAPGSFRMIPVEGLPRIAVPFEGLVGEVHRKAGAGLSVVEALSDDLRAWTGSVTVDPESGVGLALVGGASVYLGEPAKLDNKMAALRSVLAGVVLHCITDINLEMPDLPTIKRHPECPES